MDENDSINVKLSDYGIAAFATPQGVMGVAGTPAFQAPEVQKDYTYDEKVASVGISLKISTLNNPLSSTPFRKSWLNSKFPTLFLTIDLNVTFNMPFCRYFLFFQKHRDH